MKIVGTIFAAALAAAATATPAGAQTVVPLNVGIVSEGGKEIVGGTVLTILNNSFCTDFVTTANARAMLCFDMNGAPRAAEKNGGLERKVLAVSVGGARMPAAGTCYTTSDDEHTAIACKVVRPDGLIYTFAGAF